MRTRNMKSGSLAPWLLQFGNPGLLHNVPGEVQFPIALEDVHWGELARGTGCLIRSRGVRVGLENGSERFADTRLDTWKSIAQYLGRSSRTVQRWHMGYGLPVHHLGGDASSVYAYKDELDLWLRKRDAWYQEECSRSDSAVSSSPAGERRTPSAEMTSERGSGAEEETVQLVLGAQRLWESLSSSNLSSIVRMYRRAADLSPMSAVAFAGLSQALIAQVVLGNLHPAGGFHAAEAALARALEIDPELFEARCASAMIKLFVQRDWEGASALVEEALRMYPENSQALVGRAFLRIAQGRFDEASDALRRAAQARPLNTSIAELLCWVEYLSGRFESAIMLVSDARESGHSGAVLDTVEALCRVAEGYP